MFAPDSLVLSHIRIIHHQFNLKYNGKLTREQHPMDPYSFYKQTNKMKKKKK